MYLKLYLLLIGIINLIFKLGLLLLLKNTKINANHFYKSLNNQWIHFNIKQMIQVKY